MSGKKRFFFSPVRCFCCLLIRLGLCEEWVRPETFYDRCTHREKNAISLTWHCTESRSALVRVSSRASDNNGYHTARLMHLILHIILRLLELHQAALRKNSIFELVSWFPRDCCTYFVVCFFFSMVTKSQHGHTWVSIRFGNMLHFRGLFSAEKLRVTFSRWHLHGHFRAGLRQFLFPSIRDTVTLTSFTAPLLSVRVKVLLESFYFSTFFVCASFRGKRVSSYS